MLALFSAIPVAFLIHLINKAYPSQPERAVLGIGGLFAILLVFPSAAYLFSKRSETDLGKLGLIVLATIGVLLVSIYLYWVSFYVLFPADILIWSESEFVNDILKFRIGYPIYSAQENNESFIYPPGTQMLTYLLAWLIGKPISIPLYRVIQLGYVLLAVVIAVCCCRRLINLGFPTFEHRLRWLWGIVWMPIFFLIATNSLTNPYVHNLHNDALTLLVSVAAYWLLLEYISTKDRRFLVLMVIIPAAGFLVKQSLAIWALLYCAYFVFFDQQRSTIRVVTFTLAAFGGIAVVVGVCYFIWGDHFIYWNFTVLKYHPRSILRSFQHILDAWAYLTIGLLGGFMLLRGEKFSQLTGAWFVWLSLFVVEAYTSGIAWMHNHMGPGSLIAGVWFVAAMVRFWPSIFSAAMTTFRLQIWVRFGITIALVFLLLNGLGLVRIPMKSLSDDAYRYKEEIDKEFEGQSVNNILLDSGTWVYLKDDAIVKDRVTSIGDRGYGAIGDFSGIIKRLRQKRYSKILVRNLHSPDLWYDHWMWPKSSGIRQAFLENYDETRSIKAVQGKVPEANTPYLFGEISVLVPNSK